MKTLALAAAFAASAISMAGINVNIDSQYQTVVRPGSGSISVMFTGTVDVLLPTFDVNGALLEFPSDGTNFLSGSFDAAFITYLSAGAGVDYTGALFEITVQSTDDLGLYFLNSSSDGLSALSEFIVYASDGSVTAADNEMFGVEVVPEPASMVALGVGIAALARKRRKA
ncbi:MAG: PEP-CTERM sorting domain-containing protein [Fimbriimonadaceae bacterium]